MLHVVKCSHFRSGKKHISIATLGLYVRYTFSIFTKILTSTTYYVRACDCSCDVVTDWATEYYVSQSSGSKVRASTVRGSKSWVRLWDYDHPSAQPVHIFQLSVLFLILAKAMFVLSPQVRTPFFILVTRLCKKMHFFPLVCPWLTCMISTVSLSQLLHWQLLKEEPCRSCRSWRWFATKRNGYFCRRKNFARRQQWTRLENF